MGTLLRISLILLLVLSIAALALGWVLFDQRQEIRGRLELAEDTLLEVARTIERESPEELTDRDLPKLEIDREELRSYPEPMQNVLRQLRGRAASQYAYYNDTRAALAQREDEISEKAEELATKEQELAQTEQQLEAVRQEMEQARETFEARAEEIERLERERTSLQGQVADQRERIAELTDDVADLRQQNEDYLLQIENLRDQLAERPTVTDPDEEVPREVVDRRDIPRGHKGQVVLVNRDWNFVILDIARDDHAVRRDLTLFVQRADQLVGKVRVSEVKGVDRRLAVADIMDDWLQMPIEEGDYVFF